MRKWIVLAALTVFCFGMMNAAQADAEERFVPLSNQSIRLLLEQNGYRGWELFQPGSREVETNTSSTSFLKDLDRYPILARDGERVCLIVLEKKMNRWDVGTVNERALVREGFTLENFTMDENVSPANQTLYVFFDFRDAAGGRYSMELELSRVFPSYFRFIDLPTEEHENGVTYRTVVMNYDRGYDFQIDVNGGDFRCTLSVQPERYVDFGVGGFSLADCPLSVVDLMAPARTVRQSSVALYLYPLASMPPAREIGGGEEVLAAPLGYGTHWRIVQYEGQIYFTQSGNIEAME